jgi:hypothetical protein
MRFNTSDNSDMPKGNQDGGIYQKSSSPEALSIPAMAQLGTGEVAVMREEGRAAQPVEQREDFLTSRIVPRRVPPAERALQIYAGGRTDRPGSSRQAGSHRDRLTGALSTGLAQQVSFRIEEGSLGQAHRLRDGRHRQPSTPSDLAYEVPRLSVSDVLQNLPYHDPCALEGGFAMADPRVGHDMLAQLDPACGRLCPHLILHGDSVSRAPAARQSRRGGVLNRAGSLVPVQ